MTDYQTTGLPLCIARWKVCSKGKPNGEAMLVHAAVMHCTNPHTHSLHWRSHTSDVRDVRTPARKIHNFLVRDFSVL